MNFKLRSAEPLRTNGTYIARFTFGSPVVVYFGRSGIIENCKVIKVHFTEEKVFYDVEVKWQHLTSSELLSSGVDTEREITSRLYNLDSAVVLSPLDFEYSEDINTIVDEMKQSIGYALEIKDLWSADQYGTTAADVPGTLQSLQKMEYGFKSVLSKIKVPKPNKK